MNSWSNSCVSWFNYQKSDSEIKLSNNLQKISFESTFIEYIQQS